jgi:hypothetical protein
MGSFPVRIQEDPALLSECALRSVGRANGDHEESICS